MKIDFLYSAQLIVFLLLSTALIDAADTQYTASDFDKFLALSLVVRRIDEPLTLQGFAYSNKALNGSLHALHAERLSEFNNYLVGNGIKRDYLTYARSGLCAYYVSDDPDGNIYNSASLERLSQFSAVTKREMLHKFTHQSFYKEQLRKRCKPFVLDGAIYMYDTYVTAEDKAGVLVRIPSNGKREWVPFFCKISSEYVPSGSFAGKLPKLHDALFDATVCTYYPLADCPPEIAKQLAGSKKKLIGAMMADISLLQSISDSDKIFLSFFMSHEKTEHVGLEQLSEVLSIYGRMHMLMSWGGQDFVPLLLHHKRNAHHVISGYGTFKISPFTEKLSFEPHKKGIKQVKNKLAQFFIDKASGSTTLLSGYDSCHYALGYLKKQGAFVAREWQEHGKQLGKQLESFAECRYRFLHLNQQLFVRDMVRDCCYGINLSSDKNPAVMINSFFL